MAVGIKKFIGNLVFGKPKVFKTIKSVKPNLIKTVKQTKSDEFRKRYTALDKSESKIKTGKQMMREGQRERKKMVDTGRAFQFKHSKSFHAMKPGDKEKYAASMKVAKPQKKFKTGKELEREKKMGGGMMGRRFGMKKGTPNPFKKETNVDKIKKTFAPKRKKKFPDLTGDGKVTFADILKGRGVINGKKKKA